MSIFCQRSCSIYLISLILLLLLPHCILEARCLAKRTNTYIHCKEFPMVGIKSAVSLIYISKLGQICMSYYCPAVRLPISKI